MTAYHKIDSVFKRDPLTKRLIDGDWSKPEFEFLANVDWELTEKIDGTNIRVVVASDGSYSVGGRTDAAQIPAKLLARIRERLDPQRDLLATIFPSGGVIYAEGYGAGIQAAGAAYSPDQDIIVFDVRVGDWWLRRVDVTEIAVRLGLLCVPCLGRCTLLRAIEMVSSGVTSVLAPHVTNRPVLAEGAVARPAVELHDRAGRRIIAKIKTRDFRP